MLGRAASCCDLLRLSPTPGDSSEDDDDNSVTPHRRALCHGNVTSLFVALLCRTYTIIIIVAFHYIMLTEAALQ